MSSSAMIFFSIRCLKGFALFCCCCCCCCCSGSMVLANKDKRKSKKPKDVQMDHTVFVDCLRSYKSYICVGYRGLLPLPTYTLRAACGMMLWMDRIWISIFSSRRVAFIIIYLLLLWQQAKRGLENY